MKLKGILAVTLMAGMLLTLTACVGDAPPEKDKTESSAQSQNADEGEGSAPSQSAGEGESSQSPARAEQVFGKVTSIAGNEITLSMAKPPMPEEKEESGGGQAGGEGEMTGAIEATVLAPAVEGGEGVEMPKIELEYTGEEKDYVIPAGAQVIGQDGQTQGLESLKKGSVLMLNVDESGQVINVSVWE